MTARPSQFRTARRVIALCLASTATLAACGAELPTSAELQGLDVAGAEQRLTRATGGAVRTTEYYVNGKRVGEAEAKALLADRIATISIRKRDAGTNAVAITTRDSSALTIVGARTQTATAGTNAPSKPFDGLVIVDGVRKSSDALAKIAPSSIESIEVIKGNAASAVYGAAGANGVIIVTLKK